MAAEEMKYGFRTNHAFDPFFFASCLSKQESFTLISQATGARYGFMVNILNEEFVRVTHCFTAGRELTLDETAIMTLERGVDGKIVVRPGWGD